MVNDRISEAKKFFELGKNLDSIKDNEKIKYFTQAIQLNPNYAEAYYERGYTIAHKLTNFVSFNSDDREKVISDFTKAIQLNPKFVEAYFERGKAYFKMCSYDYDHHFAKNSDDPCAKKLFSDFEKVVELNPDYEDFEVFYELGHSYFSFTYYEKSLDNLKKYLKNSIHKQSAEVAYDLISRCNYELKNYEEAISYCNKTLELYGDKKFPYMFYPYLTRGKSYAALENYEKAIEDYNEVIKNHLKDAEAETYYYRGLAYKELKMYDDAYWDFTSAIDIESENGESRFKDAYELRDICKYRNENDPEAKKPEMFSTNFGVIIVILAIIYFLFF